MNVTKIKWNRKALRAVHGEPGVGAMLETLAEEVCGGAKWIMISEGANRSGTYVNSFRARLIRRRKGYYVARAENTAPHAKYVEFGTSRTEARYPLIRSAHRWYGPR